MAGGYSARAPDSPTITAKRACSFLLNAANSPGVLATAVVACASHFMQFERTRHLLCRATGTDHCLRIPGLAPQPLSRRARGAPSETGLSPDFVILNG